jgi:hypothetical protein
LSRQLGDEFLVDSAVASSFGTAQTSKNESTKSGDTIGSCERRVSWPCARTIAIVLMLTKLCVVDEYPNGFSRLAAFVNSDDDMAMVRSFGYLHTRALLQLQVEITELEKALYALDKKDETNPAMNYRRISTKHKENADNEHTVLMSEIKAKLKEYGEHSVLSSTCIVSGGTDAG